ncbi:DDE_Tnp_1_7 domain-containing protein [Trichonephila clavipes]|nr:DDE_Tnp_1_7 domain-containing protein [Trichonephila clavipes]
MGDIGHLNPTISFYRMKFRIKKWTVRVILHMVDFTMSSAWLTYRNNMTELGEPEKDILYYFAFRLNIPNTLIHGLLKKPFRLPSLAEDENDKPPPKLPMKHILSIFQGILRQMLFRL